MGGSAVNGSMANIDAPVVNGAAGIITVAVMTPFMLMGFDVIPQAAGEMNIPYKKIGKLLVLSVVMAIFWYAMIIFGVSLSMTSGELAVSGMASADAMQKAYMGSAIASKVLIMGGICGIITSWNSFYVGCSHAICAMAEEGMLPSFLAKKHKKYGTPMNAILLIAAVTSLAPFLGENMLTWLSNAGAFAIVIAYFIVSASFIKLRRKEPQMERAYKVKYGMFTGIAAVVSCGVMLFMYIPGAPAAMSVYEWSIVLMWVALGVVFYMAAMKKQKAGVVYHTKRLIVKQAVFMGMK